jgi:hypothetical protein
LGTLDGYPQRVPKQRYSPPNDEVAARIDRVVELYRQWQDSEAQYKKALAELAAPPLGDPEHVTIAHIAGRLEVERKTVYRHLGRSMT